ncbi:MAG: OadG family protein [Spirochaetota bacterium]
MHNKWMILVAGVGTVFAALAGLILLVYVLKFVFNRSAPKKVKPEGNPAPSAPSPAQKAAVLAAPVKKSEGAELVAVIAAAISASTGLEPSQFRIAAFNASAVPENGFNTPVWGRIERYSRK